MEYSRGVLLDLHFNFSFSKIQFPFRTSVLDQSGKSLNTEMTWDFTLLGFWRILGILKYYLYLKWRFLGGFLEILHPYSTFGFQKIQLPFPKPILKLKAKSLNMGRTWDNSTWFLQNYLHFENIHFGNGVFLWRFNG